MLLRGSFITGRIGAGKTTLRVLLGLLPIQAGRFTGTAGSLQIRLISLFHSLVLIPQIPQLFSNC